MPQSASEYLIESFIQGLQELRAANAGQMAMDAPPIQSANNPSYADMLERQAARVQPTAPAQEQEIER